MSILMSSVLSDRTLLFMVRCDITVLGGMLLVVRIRRVLFDRCCNRLGILVALVRL